MSRFVRRCYTAIRDWIQKNKSEILGSKGIWIPEFIIVDETIIKLAQYVWLWMIATENDNREILQLGIRKEGNMFVA